MTGISHAYINAHITARAFRNIPKFPILDRLGSMNLMTILSGLFIRKVSPCELPYAVHHVLPPSPLSYCIEQQTIPASAGRCSLALFSIPDQR